MTSVFSNQQQQQPITQKKEQQRLIVNGVNIRQKDWPACIDLSNIQRTVSLQYLHNYTYLQYSMFPQLFQVYINTMPVSQLVQKLNSYVGTFMEFFVDGIAYDAAYQFNLLMAEGNNNLSDVKQILKDCNQFISKEQVAKRLYKLVRITSIIKNDTNNNNNYQIRQVNSKLQINEQQKQQQQILGKIIQDIKTKKHLVKGLFKVICLLVQKILSQSQEKSLHALIHCAMPKYLLHAVIIQVDRCNSRKLVGLQQRFEENLKQTYLFLKQSILLRLVPVYIEVYGLYSSISSGRVKTVDMSGWDWNKIVDKMDLCLELQHALSLTKQRIDLIGGNILVESVVSNIECQISQQCVSGIGLSEMTGVIRQCLNLNKLRNVGKQTKQSQGYHHQQQQQGSSLLAQNILTKQVKQLSMENVQRLSRQFAKLFNTKSKQMQKQSKQQKQKEQRHNIKSNEHINIENKMQEQVRQGAIQYIDLEQYQEQQLMQQNGQHQQKQDNNNQLKQQQNYGIKNNYHQGDRQYNYYQGDRQKQPITLQGRSALSRLPQSFLEVYYQLLTYVHQYDRQEISGSDNSICLSIWQQHSIDNERVSQLVTELYKYINGQLRSVLSFKGTSRDNNESERGGDNIMMVEQLRGRVDGLELMTSLVLELLAMVEDRHNNYNSINNYNIVNTLNSMNPQSMIKDSTITPTTQSISQPLSSVMVSTLAYDNKQMNQIVKKAKHSLYVNLITTKIIKHSISINNNNINNKLSQQQSQQQKYKQQQQQQLKQFQQQQQQCDKQQITIKGVSQMFDAVFQLANINTTNYTNTNNNTNTNIINNSTKTENGNTVNSNSNVNIDSNSLVKLSTFPSLQTVLYMFSALQLWTELNISTQSSYKSSKSSPSSIIQQQQSQQSQSQQQQSINISKQVVSFFSSVINKYSQPNITIPSQQLIYVKYIIEMYEIYNLFINTNNNNNKDNKEIIIDNNSNNKDKDNNNKVTQKLMKLVSLSQQRDNSCVVRDSSCLLRDSSCVARVQQLINILPCLNKYIQRLIPALIAFTISPQLSQHNINQNNEYMIEFKHIISMDINEQTLSPNKLRTYITNEVLDRLQVVLMSRSKQRVVVDLNQSINNVNNQSINKNKQSKQQQKTNEIEINSKQMFVHMKRLFGQLSRKYLMFIKIKKQLYVQKNNNNRENNDNNNNINDNNKIIYQHVSEFDNLFSESYQKCMKFIIATTQLQIDSYQLFYQVHKQFYKHVIAQHQDKDKDRGKDRDKERDKERDKDNSNRLSIVRQIYKQQLMSLNKLLSDNQNQLLSQIKDKVVKLKLMIFKLSPQQIECLIKEEQIASTRSTQSFNKTKQELNKTNQLIKYTEQILKPSSQQSKTRVLQKIKQLSKFIDTLLTYSVLLTSHHQWMLMQTIVKTEYIQNQQKTLSLLQSTYSGQQTPLINKSLNIKGNNKQQLQSTLSSSLSSSLSSLSSFHLLRLLTLISWLGNNKSPNSNCNFVPNFQYLQQILQSNIQPQLISNSQSLLRQHKFQLKRLLLSQQVKQQLQYVHNYQSLQFIYEYIPFDVNTQQQQQQLYQSIKQYTLNPINHLYISQQKLQKLKFNQLSKYIQLLLDSNTSNWYC